MRLVCNKWRGFKAMDQGEREWGIESLFWVSGSNHVLMAYKIVAMDPYKLFKIDYS